MGNTIKMPTYLFLAIIVFMMAMGIISWNVLFHKKPIILGPVTHIDSTEVATLRNKIRELQNELNAKPTTITVQKLVQVPYPDTTGMSYPVYQSVEVKVYPIGSYKNTFLKHFDMVSGLDSLNLNVNINTFNYMYVDPLTQKYYHSDSLQVQLTDINMYKHFVKPQIHKRYLSFIAGINPQFSYDTQITSSKGNFVLDGINADAGIRIVDKYDIEVTASTHNIYGIRLGFRF